MESFDAEIERWEADIKEHRIARERGLAAISMTEIHTAEKTLKDLVGSLQSN